jgi:Zn-dependent peptidase ImmA (M78 family)/transcriptional regulator with XRE-family HTH domain
VNEPREFNPQRLMVARQKRGLTKARLASKGQLGLRSVTAYEAGETTPGDDAIRALSRSLDFPPSFFFMPNLELPSAYSISFRALSTMTASQRDAAIAAGAIAFELSRWLESRFNLPPCTVPDMRGFTPETAATALRQRWQLGEQPIKNAIHLLEAHGVRIFSLAEECRELDAYSLWRGSQPFVFLNTMKTGERSRHDAIHELGHLVLHRHTGTSYGRRAEQEADAFAAAMLMPRSDVLARAPRYPSLNELIRLKHRWLVSVSSLAHRLHSLNLLSDWHYRTICIELGGRGREDEPEPILRESSQVLKKAFEMARADGTSRSALAADLGINSADLDALIFGLVLTGVSGGNRVGPRASTKQSTQLKLVEAAEAEAVSD